MLERGSDGTWILDPGIKGVTQSSGAVRPGYVFVAIRGLRYDGHAYASEAVARGASAVVAEKPVPLPPGVPLFTVENGREALAELARAFYGDPSGKLCLIGITGTNGKTTVAYLTEAIFRQQQWVTGMIGTVENRFGGERVPAVLTTPEPVELQGILRRMLDAGVQVAAMEVSSHALEMGRVKGCAFDVAVFTNLHRDHLDFHPTFLAYREAKVRLFTEGLREGEKALRHAVINADDHSAEYFIRRAEGTVVTYGIANPAQVVARELREVPWGTGFRLVTPEGECRVNLPLPGLFNVYNALAAAAVAMTQGVDLSTITAALEQRPAIPGRYERLVTAEGVTTVIDYAHNPDGLRSILGAVGSEVQGKVIAVFGGRGERDRGKRPLMGAVASRYADYLVLTTDSPYREDPEKIAGEIAAGVRLGHRLGGYTVILDRGQAIAAAINLARPGDAVVITGRGHEGYQWIGDRAIPFSDRQAVVEIIGAEANPSAGVS